MKKVFGLCLSVILLVALGYGSLFAAETAVDTEKEGKVFTACKLEWKIGKNEINWTDAQNWIKGLGEDWRAPTKVDLIALFAEMGQKSPVSDDFVWAEERDGHSAWYFSFYFQEIRWSYKDDSSRWGRVVAVRPVK